MDYEILKASYPLAYLLLLIPVGLIALKCILYVFFKNSKFYTLRKIARFISTELTTRYCGIGYEIYVMVSMLSCGIFVLCTGCYFPLRNQAIKKFEKFPEFKYEIEHREALSHDLIKKAENYNVWMEDAVYGHNENFKIEGGYNLELIDTKELWKKHGGEICCALLEERQDSF